MRFVARPEAVEGYEGRGVDGAVYRPPAGSLFRDESGATWWIIFQASPGSGPHGPKVKGDVLACSAAHDQLVHVRVLARDVLCVEADAAFHDKAPNTYEEALDVAASIPGQTDGSFP
ncbi:hypothetical protein QFZ40_002209 [Arthrobacter pascens]|uniref:hypothetical protein n=1 Tax=Arthrobacter pascens TaxID=1677 RepID=UPI0027834E2F|nr:hypothetical protein [Arthrobacter pascens]MDQ0634300.1 hypothetical protein [Arthrobacter pascens]